MLYKKSIYKRPRRQPLTLAIARNNMNIHETGNKNKLLYHYDFSMRNNLIYEELHNPFSSTIIYKLIPTIQLS